MSTPADLLRQVAMSPDEQRALAERLYTAMKAVLTTRWRELHLLNLPPAALSTLQRLAQEMAASVTATFNRDLEQVITREVARGVTDLAQLRTVVQAWLTRRAEWKPDDIAQYAVNRALSLADLYGGNPDTYYTLDGAPLTATSCATCRAYYGAVLTRQQAWAFTPHINCGHYIRQVTASDLRS